MFQTFRVCRASRRDRTAIGRPPGPTLGARRVTGHTVWMTDTSPRPMSDRPAGPLDGVTVLELGTLIAGPHAARLLGDMGADVIKIEPPGKPDPIRTWGQAEVDGHRFYWTVHGRNKKAVTLDLRADRGR